MMNSEVFRPRPPPLPPSVQASMVHMHNAHCIPLSTTMAMSQAMESHRKKEELALMESQRNQFLNEGNGNGVGHDGDGVSFTQERPEDFQQQHNKRKKESFDADSGIAGGDGGGGGVTAATFSLPKYIDSPYETLYQDTSKKLKQQQQLSRRKQSLAARALVVASSDAGGVGEGSIRGSPQKNRRRSTFCRQQPTELQFLEGGGSLMLEGSGSWRHKPSPRKNSSGIPLLQLTQRSSDGTESGKKKSPTRLAARGCSRGLGQDDLQKVSVSARFSHLEAKHRQSSSHSHGASCGSATALVTSGATGASNNTTKVPPLKLGFKQVTRADLVVAPPQPPESLTTTTSSGTAAIVVPSTARIDRSKVGIDYTQRVELSTRTTTTTDGRAKKENEVVAFISSAPSSGLAEICHPKPPEHIARLTELDRQRNEVGGMLHRPVSVKAKQTVFKPSTQFANADKVLSLANRGTVTASDGFQQEVKNFENPTELTPFLAMPSRPITVPAPLILAYCTQKERQASREGVRDGIRDEMLKRSHPAAGNVVGTSSDLSGSPLRRMSGSDRQPQSSPKGTLAISTTKKKRVPGGTVTTLAFDDPNLF